MRGAVLVYTLWFMAFLSVMIFLSSYQLYRVKASASNAPYMWTSIYEMKALAYWSIQLAVNSPSILRSDHGLFYRIENREYKVFVRAEEGKISLRMWGPEILERLLIEKGMERKRAKETVEMVFKSLPEIRSTSELATQGLSYDVISIIREYFTLLPILTNINFLSEDNLRLLGFSQEDTDFIKENLSNRGYVLYDEILERLPSDKKNWALQFTYTPRPLFYNIKVSMEKPYKYTITYIMSADGKLYDAWEE